MFTAEFIEKQMSLAKSATPRPWKWNAEDGSLLLLESECDAVLLCDEDAIECGCPTKEDTVLIVSAVNNWTDALTAITERDAAIAERDTEIKRLREALTEIRDLARTGLPPAGMDADYWQFHKLNKIAAEADAALGR